jgi:hypothetical protein
MNSLGRRNQRPMGKRPEHRFGQLQTRALELSEAKIDA